jgi:lysophospholipase L1-like esterase
MKKTKMIIIVIIILAAAGIYLNRSYSHIYSKFNKLSKPQSFEQVMEIKNNTIKYVALGDSLTYGMGAQNQAESFPYLLAGKLSSSTTTVEAVNLAMPGETSAGLLRDQIAEAVKQNPQMITLLIGINDIHNRVTKDAYQKNLSAIVKTLQEKTLAKIYLINLPDLGTKTLILPPYNLYFDVRTKEFNEIISNVAKEYGIAVIDIYQSKTIFKHDKLYYSADQFHPSAKGYELWTNLIYDQLQ